MIKRKLIQNFTFSKIIYIEQVLEIFGHLMKKIAYPPPRKRIMFLYLPFFTSLASPEKNPGYALHTNRHVMKHFENFILFWVFVLEKINWGCILIDRTFLSLLVAHYLQTYLESMNVVNQILIDCQKISKSIEKELGQLKNNAVDPSNLIYLSSRCDINSLICICTLILVYISLSGN